MSDLNTYFAQEDEQAFTHPVLALVDQTGTDRVTVEVYRPKDVLGLKPTRLFLHFHDVNNVEMDLREFAWDDELNEALIARGVKAVSEDNEKTRFALSLQTALRGVETRYGDGFFNAVLVEYVRESPLGRLTEIAATLRDVHSSKPHMGGNSYADCRLLIERVIRGRARKLTASLIYPQPAAEQILGGAIARYLDERFSVTDRRRLGF